MQFVNSVVVLLSSFYCFIQCVEILEGCNELVQSDPGKFERLKLSELDNNLSKTYEVFRLKMVYRGEKFAFGINYNNSENYMMFGPHGESFGGYKNFTTFTKQIEPCSVRGNNTAFDASKHTSLEGVLTKGKLHVTQV